MVNKKNYIILLLVVSIIFISLYAYERQLNSRIIKKHRKIGLITDCNLALEINHLVSERELTNSEEVRRIKSLVDILYTNGSLYSNYEISSNRYLNNFEEFSYFEDYAYYIKQMIKDETLDDEEINELEKYRKEMENILIKQSEILN